MKKAVVLLALPALLIIDFLFTGIWVVQENEQGVVLRFGAVQRKAYPGLTFTLPWPVETMRLVNIKETLKMPVGFRFIEGMDPSLSLADESEWLTGDMNVIDVEMMIHYTVSDPVQYLFRVGPLRADFLIRKCSESVLTELIGIMSVDACLTTEKKSIVYETLKRTQALLDSFETGVTLSRANLQKIAPPAEVINAFEDVTDAKNDKDRFIKEADGYGKDLMPTARYEAAHIEQQALAYESLILTEAEGRADRFKSIYEEYRNAPEITETRLFLETMEQVLSRPRKIIVNLDDDGKARVRIIK